MKKVLLALFVFLLLLGGCAGRADMPFHGPVTFHEITAAIPDSFVRDSTQSSDDLWVFEQGGHAKLILLSRRDIDGDLDASLDAYVDYLKSEGADAERGQFLYTDAIHSTYTKDGQYCQEILFACNGSFYAVALRGGTEEEFQNLLNGVNTPETAPSTT